MHRIKIGMEINNSFISTAAVSKELHVFGKQSLKIDNKHSYEEIRDKAVSLIENIIKEEGLDKASISAIGIGCSGKCNPLTGTVEFSSSLNKNNIPLKDDMEKIFGIKTFLNSNGNAAAYGEFYAGTVKDLNLNSAVIITLGDNISSGIIINKNLFFGENFYGAEIGHMIIEVDGALCSCGRKGCFEAYSSVTGLLRMTREALKENPNSSIQELVEKDGKISARTSFNAARLEDEAGVAVVNKYIKYLAAGLANIINILHPEIICIGGDICKEGELLLKPLKEQISKLVYSFEGDKKTEIAFSSLGGDAAIIGAVMLCK